MAKLRAMVIYDASDRAFCEALVAGLRAGGADVWYDEEGWGPEVLRREMMEELAARPVTIIVLSKAAMNSAWVREECEWVNYADRWKAGRLVLPVVAAAYDKSDLKGMKSIKSFERIEAGRGNPVGEQEARARVFLAVGLWAAGVMRPSPYMRETFDATLHAGRGLAQHEMYVAAQPLFERATGLEPMRVEGWSNLAWCLARLKRYQQALDASERALALRPRSAPDWNTKGVALRNLGRVEEGLNAFHCAVQADPNYLPARDNIGLAMRDLKRYDEALESLDCAIALSPVYEPAWLTKGSVLYDLKRYEESLAVFERALSFDSSDTFAWNGKGIALYKLGRYEEAVNAHERLVSLDSSSDVGWTNMGTALARLGRFDEARAAEERALALNPTPVHWLNLGFVLSLAGRHEEAIVAYDRGKPWEDDGLGVEDLTALATTLRAVGRDDEAAEAEKRAEALVG